MLSAHVTPSQGRIVVWLAHALVVLDQQGTGCGVLTDTTCFFLIGWVAERASCAMQTLAMDLIAPDIVTAMSQMLVQVKKQEITPPLATMGLLDSLGTIFFSSWMLEARLVEALFFYYALAAAAALYYNLTKELFTVLGLRAFGGQ